MAKLHLAALSVTAAVLTAGPVFAHHSGAMFDRAKTTTITGTVKEFRYTNPHCWIMVTTTAKDGTTAVWAIETSGPQRVKSWGLAPSTLKSGDKVTVNLYPLRDGRLGGSLLDITLPNGKTIKTTS